MLNKDANNVGQVRSSIIQSFISLEYSVEGAIAGEYFIDSSEDILWRFWTEALNQELFSFELKKRIMYTFLREKHPELYKRFPKKALDRLQVIRNIVAHSIEISNGDDYTEMVKSAKMSFYRNGKDYSVSALYTEYCDLYEEVETQIRSLPNAYIV